MLKFQNFYQPVGPVGNRFNRFYQTVPFYKQVTLIRPVLPHPSLELSAFFFLDSLFIEESYVKVSEFLSIGWTNWEPVQQVLHD